MLKVIRMIKWLCVILALVSSKGDVINVDHLRYLKPIEKGCLVAQYYNPPFIHSDWSCKEVEQSIIYAIQVGCNKC